MLGRHSPIGTLSRSARLSMCLNILSQRIQEAREAKWPIQLLRSPSGYQTLGSMEHSESDVCILGSTTRILSNHSLEPQGNPKAKCFCPWAVLSLLSQKAGVTTSLFGHQGQGQTLTFHWQDPHRNFKDRDLWIFLSRVRFLALDHPRFHVPGENACSIHTRSINCSDCGAAMICS